MTETVIAYTRGRKLHAGRFEEGRRFGKLLCGSYGFRHPRFDSGADTAVGLTLRFNDGCKRCIAALDREGE